MRSGDFKTSYREDFAILQTRFIKITIALFVAALCGYISLTDNSYLIYLVNISAIATIGALGLNVLTGLTGQISVGHAGFLAIGSYGSAILNNLGLPFCLSLPLGGAVAALAGLIVGLPSLKMKGLYLAITTFAFGFIVEHLANSWVGLTKGANGMEVMPPQILGYAFDDDRKFFFVVFPIACLAVIYTRNLLRSRPGRAWIAIRDRDLAAEGIGISLYHYKLSAFCVSSFLAGLAGGLYGHYMQYISPTNFEMFVSVQYLAMIIVGGMGSVLGSIFGAIFMTLVPELLKYLPDMLRDSYPLVVERFADVNLILFGLIIMLFVIIEPKGLYGIWQNIKTYWRMWPYTH